jgi:hypothetical protein
MLYGKMRQSPLRGTTSMSNTAGPMTSSATNTITIKDIMTEADTFNALKKSTYEVVYNEWRCVWFIGLAEQITVFDKYGWTYADFYKEYNKRAYDRR